MKPPTVPEREVEFTAVRAQGPGGQNVNKVSTAVHLRFDIRASSLPDDVKARLLALPDRRVTDDGTVVIKAQAARSRDANRADALRRLDALVARAAAVPRARRATVPTRASVERRLDAKGRRAEVKAARGAHRHGERIE